MTPEGSSPQLRVFVGGFGGSATEFELREAFDDVGVELNCVDMIVHAATGCSRGFAFVVVSRLLAASPSNDDDLLVRMRAAVVRGRPLTIHHVPSGLNRHVSR